MYMYQPADDEWVTDLRDWIQSNPLNLQSLPGFEYIPIRDEPDPEKRLRRIMEMINSSVRPAPIVKPKIEPITEAQTLRQLNSKIRKLLDMNTKENGYAHASDIRELRRAKALILKRSSPS
jgi:hypothetical protein